MSPLLRGASNASQPTHGLSRLYRPALMAVAAATAVSGLLLPTTGSPAQASVAEGDGSQETVTPDLATLQRVDANATSNTYRLTDDTYVYEGYGEPVNYRGAGGEWLPIDPAFEQAAPSGDGAKAVSTGTPYEAVIPSDPANGFIQFRTDAVTIKMRLRRLDATPPSVSGDTAEVQSSALDAEVEYELGASELKEKIVLSEAPTQAPVYKYDLRAVGAKPVLEASGAISFIDESGKVSAVIPAGLMWDSSPDPQYSEDVEYDLAENGTDAWILTVVPSFAWLTSSATHYPVTVDPSIGTSYRDCWIDSTSPTSSKCGDGSQTVRVGVPYSGQKQRALFDFDTSIIPASAVISDSSLDLYLDTSLTTNPGPSTSYGLYQAGKRFDGTATWNKPTAATTWTGGDPTGTVLATNSLSGDGASGYRKFGPFNGLLTGWITGATPHRGLVLKQVSETTTQVLRFTSSSTATANDGKRPRLSVTYTDSIPTSTSSSTYVPITPSTIVQATGTAQLLAGESRLIAVSVPSTIPDPLDVDEWAVQFRASNWSAEEGSLEATDIDDNAVSALLPWNYSDSKVTGRTTRALVAPTTNNTFVLTNKSSGTVDVTAVMEGYYRLEDEADVDASTPPVEGQDDYGPFEIFPGDTGAGTPLARLAGGSSEDCTPDASGFCMVEMEIANTTSGDSMTSIDGGAGGLARPQVDCWQDVQQTNRWYTHRKEACLVGVYKIIYKDPNIPPEVHAEKGPEGIMFMKEFRKVELFSSNLDFNQPLQIRFMKCGGTGDPRPADKQTCPGTNFLDNGAYFRAYLDCPTCAGGGSRDYYEGTHIGPMSDTSPVLMTGHRDRGTIPSGDRMKYFAPGVAYTWSLDSYSWSDKRYSRRSPDIRCDNWEYVNSSSRGCVFNAKIPYMHIDGGTGSATYHTAQNIRNLQNLIPHHFGSTRHSDAYPLTRLWTASGALKKLHRSAACRKVDKPSTGGPYECDEYPFASTYQGCASVEARKAGECGRKVIPAADNQAGGRIINAFYRKNRLLDGDPFFVNVD